MSEGYVQVAPDGAGKKVDNTVVTNQNGDVVYRQAVQIVDPANEAARTAVRNTTPSPSDYGVTTRPAPANFDTGVFAGSGSLDPVPNTQLTDQLYLDAIRVHVTVGIGKQTVVITNAAGQSIYNEDFYEGTVVIAQHGCPVTGLKVNAPPTVTVHIWGRKA